MDNKLSGNKNNIVFYTDENGNTNIEVILQNEDVWLNVQAIAELFDVQRPAITKHINNIYNENELEENSTCSKMEHMGNSGKQKYEIKYYNLDMIISIGFRVDYNPESEEAYTFFKIVQNKLHYAISGHTAAELIFNRANSDEEHMGLTNWKNSPNGLIYKYDVTVAKNYLNEEELKKLNDLTNFFIVFAEDEAKERHIMTMQDMQYISSMDEMYQRYLSESKK